MVSAARLCGPGRSKVLWKMMRPALAIALIAVTAAASFACGDESHLPAPYRTETEAVADGLKLGIGSAVVEGPATVEVATDQSWTLVYTAGKAGVRPGGGVRIGMRHVLNWTRPQTDEPKARGYFTVETPDGQPAKIDTGKPPSRFFGQYFAWQNMVEVILPERGMRPGETLRMTYGDLSAGSPGVRIQPFDETRFVFKVYVDATGDDGYLPLADNPAIEIIAAPATRLAAVMPSDAIEGKPTWCLVRAEDRYGNPAPGYRGTVRLKSTGTAAEVPDSHTFTEADRGVHRFENVVLGDLGVQQMTASDGTLRATSNPVLVATERPERLLLWGDLHGHTLHSDGRGTVEEYYDFGDRVAGLDFSAVTDHAFQITDAMWEHSKEVTNRFNRPGRFVTLQSYEWSGATSNGGDHNVYFIDDDPPLYRSDNYYDPRNLQMDHGPAEKVPHVTGVYERLREHFHDENVFCIPHYGGRPANPEWHDPQVQRLIEIFSEHRRSEEWANKFLTRGYRLGVIASTDGHFGNPGYGYLNATDDWDTQEIGMAAVAVYAKEHTRESIFSALYNRRAYATSGDRILLDVQADGHPMGTEFLTTAAPLLAIDVVGTAPILRVEIKKDSRVVHVHVGDAPDGHLEWRDAEFDPGTSGYYYVRVVQTNGEEAISSPIWVN